MKRVTLETDGDGRYNLLHEEDALEVFEGIPVLIDQWRGHSFLITDEEEAEATRLEETSARARADFHGFLWSLERKRAWKEEGKRTFEVWFASEAKVEPVHVEADSCEAAWLIVQNDPATPYPWGIKELGLCDKT